MFVSHKSNVIQHIHQTEWECRRMSKGMSKPEYGAWLETITSGDYPVITYPSEDFTIVECSDENVWERLAQLDDYVSIKLEGRTYNIKWSDEKKDGSHFTGDDTAKDKRILDEEWVNIRTERDRLLAETDWMANSDVTMSAANKTYRQKLRDLPSDQSSKKTYADITWPTKP